MRLSPSRTLGVGALALAILVVLAETRPVPALAADAPAAPVPPPAPVAPPCATPAAPVPGSAPGPVQVGNELRLTLADALRLGLERNLELASGAYGPPIARETIVAEEGLFDTLLTASFSGGRQELLSNVVFDGSRVTREDFWGGRVGLSRRLRTGGHLGVVFHADRLFTNSAVATVNPRWAIGTTVEYAQPLLRGAGDVATADLRRARNGARAADGNLRSLTDDVLLRIETVYWNLSFFEAQVAARRTSEGVSQELLDQTQVRYDAKVATVLDLAEARAGLANRRGDRILAEGLRAQAEDDLRALILPFDAGARARITLRAVDDPRRLSKEDAVDLSSEDRYVSQAVRGRPELATAQATVDDRGIDVEVARNDLLPQLDLVARFASDGLEDRWGHAWAEAAGTQAGTAVVGLEFSVYLGRRTAKAKLCVAEWSRRQAVLSSQELLNRIVLEVRSALREISTATQRRDAAAEEIKSAREALEGEQVREKNGESTPFRVLEKEDLLTQAVTRENRTLADIRIARARLWKAVGLLAEVRRVPLPKAGR